MQGQPKESSAKIFLILAVVFAVAPFALSFVGSGFAAFTDPENYGIVAIVALFTFWPFALYCLMTGIYRLNTEADSELHASLTHRPSVDQSIAKTPSKAVDAWAELNKVTADPANRHNDPSKEIKK